MYFACLYVYTFHYTIMNQYCRSNYAHHSDVPHNIPNRNFFFENPKHDEYRFSDTETAQLSVRSAFD